MEVLLLSEVRGPAAVAQTLYRETEESKELRLKAVEERKAMRQFEPFPTGRPSKRDSPEDHPVPRPSLTPGVMAR